MWSVVMGFWQPVTNLREYISQNPPVVTFFLCLFTLAFSFIYLSYYSYTHTLPNPDKAKDWNYLLSSLSQLQLCVKVNESSSELFSPVPFHLMEQGKDRETLVNFTKTSSVTHLHVKVPLVVTTSSAGGSLKDLGLHTTLRASQLLFGGNEIVNVTLELLSENNTHSCLTISAPKDLLPLSLLPPACPASEKNISFLHVEASDQFSTGSKTCYNLQSKNDPTLTVMLTQEEQSVAVRHLLEVSLWLLGVCFILCLVASFTDSHIHRYHWSGLDQQNEPFINS
ncbi:transmembrane protein 248 [Mastacembelus armatus]|uniref:Uncharacterized LOC113139520 n=1 Tax=Mastacembelus armatus TaxID=205130 RepID=A0A3Q3MEZ1_9TELE|nr:transmembrane protein 248-like [Mastacembelus armatus]